VFEILYLAHAFDDLAHFSWEFPGGVFHGVGLLKPTLAMV
jgi:hypothetical protein